MIRDYLKNYFVRVYGFEAEQTRCFFRFCEACAPNDIRDMQMAKRLDNDP